MRQRSGWFLALAILVSACQPDRNPAEPGNEVESVSPSPLDVLPTNGGLVPSPIITSNPDGSETIRFKFTFDDSVHNREIEGQPYGVWFGEGDSLVAEPPTGNVAFRVYHSWEVIYNLPSPSHYAAQPASIRQSFLYFDPPVRRVSFSYASAPGDGATGSPIDAFAYWVVSTTGSTLKADSIHANNPSNDDYSNWDTLTAYSTNDDVIDHIFFNGSMIIDDLEIVREGSPAIECDTVARGTSTSCSVKPQVLATLDSITDWTFTTVLPGGPPDTITSTASGSSWSGVAVQSGDVEAVGWIGVNPSPLHGSLVVNDRVGPEWEWSALDWSYEEGGGMVGCPIPYWNKFGPSDSTTLGVNLRAESCDPNSVEPVVADLSGDPGFVATQVTDGGPNNELWYVASADYYMDRGSLTNPSILAGYPPDTLGKKDSKDCPQNLRTGPGNAAVVNFYQYNTECQSQSAGVQAIYEGTSRHEGFGTGGAENGHEARRRLGALQPANYPAAAAERLVAADSAGLDFRVRIEVDIVDVVISQEADPFHILVNGNFSSSVYAMRHNGNYQLRTVTDGN